MGELFLERYEAIRYLGHGSMGQVYLARPIDVPEALVVVKLMHDHVANQPRFRQLFEREIQSMMGLAHPYIVQLIDASLQDAKTPCLVMEYIPGVGLEVLLRHEKRLAAQRVGTLLGYLCHALRAAHAKGIVHRDLKPANLMVVHAKSEWEGLRVMDFGLSKMTTKPHLTPERLTGSGPVSAQGTPNYICPDQLRGDEIDGRADIYSVGVMLYEMLAGRLPYVYHQPQPLLQAHLYEKPLPFRLLGITDVPPRVEQVVAHCLAKYPNERPQSAEELACAYSAAVGFDILELTQPSVSQYREPPKVEATAPTPEDSVETIHFRFEAWMPERMATVKLGGFIQDMGGQILQSEPGLLRVQIGDVDTGGWLVALGLRKPKHDPILVDFRLSKPNPTENCISITVRFYPPEGYKLRDPIRWWTACKGLIGEIKGYLLVKS
jgi:eukaryotic-like serine/threonine-protein kinase